VISRPASAAFTNEQSDFKIRRSLMACKVHLSLVSETQEGNIGSDWRYSVQVKAFNGGLQGEGTLDVPKHTLDAGSIQPPPGPPEILDIDAGECGSEVLLKIKFTATEIDLLKNDSGTSDSSLVLKCPGPGEEPARHDIELSAGVRESPGILHKNAVFTLKARVVAVCE
jgi:hypothetical protein